ncbi:hypothetical protein MLD38_029025 [Melastoma candidum]|uniref:Uncharacterized protein n=1 Tax=Melastoma candidum TaxID=119954 RepID=A0ACB9N2U0_9MYRT|nr:hypothetical protein MLD38_029025 [Melastoma candidum]
MTARQLALLVIVVLRRFLVAAPVSGLNVDGVLLLSFKYSILKDTRGALRSWNYRDANPCSWRGVTCGPPGETVTRSRVVGVSLPSCGLRGSMSANLGTIKFLHTLDLSNNSLNGTVPVSLFSAPELRVLDLSNNGLTGMIPESIGEAKNLQLLNLSYNGLEGSLPGNMTALRNMTVISLRNNYFGGAISDGFSYMQVLDLSTNMINGSLPPNFGGDALHYLNLSHNQISGKIPQEFGRKIPGNATLDLSFNNITGEIPKSAALLNQGSDSYLGNRDLCGLPTKNPCPVPSPSPNPNFSAPTSNPAVAAFPGNSTGRGISPRSTTDSRGHEKTRLRPFKIAIIVVANAAGIIVTAILLFYVYQLKKKKSDLENLQKEEMSAVGSKETWSSTSSDSPGYTRCSCLRKRGDKEVRLGTTGSDREDYNTLRTRNKEPWPTESSEPQRDEGVLVTVYGKDLEQEKLLMASAYILSTTGSSIIYKAVLEDGTALAVRRIGGTRAEQFKEFESSVRAIAKLSHPNLVRIRGFYWGTDDKLVICDFIPNGSLAKACSRNAGSSQCHLPWETRLKIARGVARGLAYLHERKQVHGNLKPSNILLGADMEPKIGDVGLDRLMPGDMSYKAGGSASNLSGKSSTARRESFEDTVPGLIPSPSSVGGPSPYHSPESSQGIKPNPRWDAYSFGVVLLELMAGKVVTVDESGQANGVAVDDPGRAVRMADAAIKGEVEGREEAMLECFRLGLGCASPVPNKRPSMKEAGDVLEKIIASFSSSTSRYHLD